LVSSSLDDSFKVWDTETGQELFSSSAATGGFDTFANVAFSPDGSLLISIDFLSTEETEMKVWGVDRDWVLLNQFKGPAILIFSPDGRWLVRRGCRWNDIQLWDLAKLSAAELANLDLHKVEPLVIPEAHKAVILNFAFSPDGMRMTTSSLDGTARVWSLSPDGVDPLMTLSGHDNIVYDVAFSPDGTRVATSSPDGTVRVWDITPAGTSELFAFCA
jgi:WD40 repeat protein